MRRQFAELWTHRRSKLGCKFVCLARLFPRCVTQTVGRRVSTGRCSQTDWLFCLPPAPSTGLRLHTALEITV